ncbi:hypothetical protein [Shinella sp. HZN7]|uniref:hypothetical protein n=1 Tax=Shinella sp. (strain HZN7) TaxID=879274 RepID=UPI000A6CEFC7|nr:hypothetical protein [Shinella sp. HZN7]
MAQVALKTVVRSAARNAPDDTVDWKRIAYLVHLSRALDEMEETRLVPERKVLYQFSARGHDMAQIMLGCLLTDRHDATCGYYRSRRCCCRSASIRGCARFRHGPGRWLFRRARHRRRLQPSEPRRRLRPADVRWRRAQYTPTAGWAQAVKYYAETLGKADYERSNRRGARRRRSVASNGFWSALTIATTQTLRCCSTIEDNGYGISVPSTIQTPGGNIAANLSGWQNLTIFEGDGTDRPPPHG